jgi:hypothetical protein
MKDKKIEFIPSGRGKARCAADPNYPHGIALPCPEGTTQRCFVELPYPAPECGMSDVHCRTCAFSLLITAAGRADDPISVEMPCSEKVQ